MTLFRSIGGRLFLSYLAVVVVGLLAAAFAIGGLLFKYEDDVTRIRLQELAAPFQAAIQNGVRDGKQPREIIDGLAEQAKAADARMLIVSPGTNPQAPLQRRVLIDSEGSLINTRFPLPSSGNIGEFTDRAEVWIFVQQQLRTATLGAGGQGQIVVARPRAVYTDAIRALLPSLITAGLVAAGFALVVAGVLARTITGPLRRLVGGARTLARGSYGARVPVGGPGEVRELGAAFNEMAGEIERSRGSEQAFLADISHELRTPLTSIQGFAQAIVEGEARGEGVTRAAEVIRREARRLVRMVEGLLQVAKIESGAQHMGREPIAAAELVRAAVAALDVQAKDAGVSFDVQTIDPSGVVGDRDRLSQLFLNVLDNALKHSPRGAVVHVVAGPMDGEVVVRVRDAGAGLPPGAEGRERLFERFWRGENAAPDGAGLGLAIAQAIARTHGGSIDARDAAGGGAEFAIHLPAASTAATAVAGARPE